MQNKNIPADTPLDHLWNWLYMCVNLHWFVIFVDLYLYVNGGTFPLLAKMVLVHVFQVSLCVWLENTTSFFVFRGYFGSNVVLAWTNIKLITEVENKKLLERSSCSCLEWLSSKSACQNMIALHLFSLAMHPSVLYNYNYFLFSAVTYRVVQCLLRYPSAEALVAGEEWGQIAVLHLR